MKSTRATSPEGNERPKISARKQEANRRNALRSTGPRTPDGKARVSLNAVKHGILAKQAAVLPLENAAEYTAFAEQLRVELQPVGLVEGELVDQIIACMWRLRRLGRMETGILVTQYFTILTEEEQGLHREYNDVVSARADP